MLTHVHKVIHKVVGTFARVLRGREKWRLPLPHAELARQDSVKKQRQNRSLEVIRRWPRGHLRVQSVQAEARTKELSERTLATVHSASGAFLCGRGHRDRTQCVSVRCK
jgi:hypothetical protein